MSYELSIIIINLNTKHLVVKCLKSIFAEFNNFKSSELKADIIVVDNGSSDGSVNEINKLNNKDFIQTKGRKLHIIENQENIGFAKAVNQAIEISNKKNFLLLNSDTQLLNNCLKNLLEFIDGKTPVIVGLQMLNPDLTPQASVFNFPSITRAIKEYWIHQKGTYSKYFPKTNEPIEVEAVSGGAMFLSQGIIEKNGKFDERYFFYFEDLDFCRKARRNGIKVYYLPSAKIIHEHGASGKYLADPKNQWKRLIPSSKIYHGIIKHYVINSIILVGQKLFNG